MSLVHSDNKITSSKHYAGILREYNDLFAKDGKVNKKKFFETIVKPRIDIHIRTWYGFLRNFETEVGLAVPTNIHPDAQVGPEIRRAIIQLKGSDIATRDGIAKALNIGSETLQDLMDHPELLTTKDKIDLLFKAMKAQDSRVIAAAKANKERREIIKFNRAFDGATFADSD